MILEVLKEPHPALRKEGITVYEFVPRISEIIRDLKDTMHKHGAVGLAATQCGIILRVCVIQTEDENVVLELVNPQIIWRSQGKIYSPEGCLSMPGYRTIVPRSSKIKVGFRTRDGKVRVLTLGTPISIRVQHECDHLSGILLRDYDKGQFVKG